MINPLHQDTQRTGDVLTILMLSDNRGTGRTTAIALRAIADAIDNPYKPVKLKDHHPTKSADAMLAQATELIVWRLGLRHMQVMYSQNLKEFTLKFGLPQ